jgi:hypothetical protein
MLGLLDLAATDFSRTRQTATATITDPEQLAQRYQTLHVTIDSAALLTPVAAHVRMGDDHGARLGKRLAQGPPASWLPPLFH